MLLSSKLISIFSAEIINEIDSFILSKLESIFMYILQEKKQKYKEFLFPLDSERSGCSMSWHKLYIKTIAASGT